MVLLHKPVRVSNPWQLVQNSRAGPANLKGDERGTRLSYRGNSSHGANNARKTQANGGKSGANPYSVWASRGRFFSKKLPNNRP